MLSSSSNWQKKKNEKKNAFYLLKLWIPLAEIDKNWKKMLTNKYKNAFH